MVSCSSLCVETLRSLEFCVARAPPALGGGSRGTPQIGRSEHPAVANNISYNLVELLDNYFIVKFNSEFVVSTIIAHPDQGLEPNRHLVLPSCADRPSATLDALRDLIMKFPQVYYDEALYSLHL